ncbi:dTDP-4-dehydrorhamnose reductase family protein [Porphyrobacter sp. LM 6]|uniref:dTDP-4-dehydrorhamnose reductase family protein n=1 Tax=Porphyrobacter sp. LM 6 TaxID=1896196 RepID=UPI00086391B1|nr:SDR family oxidoreductase [Porphyrobacter sp. LM 6]AOL94042.1 dTDP-4-dehydrorhamnose reductase [Porphyrobacter sp. LM 6]
MTELRKPRVLVFGATGMLGSTLFRAFSADQSIETFGTIRDSRGAKHFAPELRNALIPGIHLESETGLLAAFSMAKPDVVVNCVGIIKQLPNANDHLESLAVNSSLPHRLARYSRMVGARLIHFSTDCVFSGRGGRYKEEDPSDAYDLYGRTKLLGEVHYENSITLRTSIIGHELASAKSLVDWFLSQSGEVKGFTKAVFSGLPTIEIARVVRECVIPNPKLYGLYHLSVDPISKFDLLSLIAETYGKDVEIIRDDQLVIDRSLNSDRFQAATGFSPRPWPDLIKDMYDDYLANAGTAS